MADTDPELAGGYPVNGCPNDEHRLNTCHVCNGSGVVGTYDDNEPCSRCGGHGHFHD